MAWVLGLIILTGLVYLAYTAPEMRTGIIIFIGVVAIGVGVLVYTEYKSEQEAETAIKPAEIELRDFETYKTRGIFYTKGSVKNLSPTHPTESLEIRIRALDCPDANRTDNCEIVGESIEKIHLDVPPGQVRGIEQPAGITSLPEVHTLSWSYDVISVRAGGN